MQGFKWSCRDSNPGPDKEAVVLSTCVSMLEFSRRRRRTSGRCASLRGSWVSLLNHHSPEASSYLRRSELPGVRAGPGGTMALPNSKLGSHGVRIVASCCSIDFFYGRASINSRHAYPRLAQAVNSGQPRFLVFVKRTIFRLADKRAAKVRGKW